MGPRKALGKLGRHALASLGILGVLAACSQPNPAGQVVAVVGSEEVTFRELEQYRRGAGALTQKEALAELVERKILVAEAERRDAEQEGQFHFALREAREQLLVEALRRQIAGELVRASQADIAARMAASPWRYRERFRLGLVAVEGQGEESAWLESAAYVERPPQDVLDARVGDILETGGGRWRVFTRQAEGRGLAEIERMVAAEIQREATDVRLRQLIAASRQSGMVRYQTGFGPAGGD